MLDVKPGHRLPPYAGTIGMWLFLAALTMLFGATLIGYFIIRASGSQSPDFHSLHLPRLLYLSTALIVLGSFTIHQAVEAVRRERQQLLRRLLIATCALAAGFILVQTPAMILLVQEHSGAGQRASHLYIFICVLIAIHAAHLVGGIVGLGVTTLHAFQGRYDHERYGGVKHAAMYWHFLDIVWIVMYSSLALAG
jgi:heme/copper-type cytochrome/quinol oxidase subunit 3